MAARSTPGEGAAERGRPLVSAGSARSQLLTVLGELVMPNGNSVWTSSLLYVLTGLGIEEQTARQAIARGAAAGWITARRQGREVQWELTPDGRREAEQGDAALGGRRADGGAVGKERRPGRNGAVGKERRPGRNCAVGPGGRPSPRKMWAWLTWADRRGPHGCAANAG